MTDTTVSIPEAFRKADAGVALGQITARERDAYLEQRFGSADMTEALFLAAQQRASKQHYIPIASKQTTRVPTLLELGRDPRPLVAGFIILMVALFGSLYWMGGGVTGAVVQDTALDFNTITHDSTITIDSVGNARVCTSSGSCLLINASNVIINNADVS